MVAGTGIALILLSVVGYFLAINSEPFSYTKNQLEKHPSITQKVGKPEDFNLNFFGYAIKHSGPKEEAEFELIVKGEEGETKVNIRLETNLGIWEIVGLRIDGVIIEQIKIDNFP